jgi:S1-C subfamily serine protease
VLPPKLFGSVRTKLWIAVGSVAILALGWLTLPPPALTTVAPPQERATPLLEAEVERREQLRIFEEIQQLGPRLVRHSVTIPADPPVPPLPSDLMPRAPRSDPAGHGLIISADGDVLTAAGALRGRESLAIQLFDGRQVTAQVVAFDPDADLVLLQSTDVPRTDAAPWATTPPTAGMLGVAVSHVSGQVAVAPVFVMAAPDADRRVRMTNADLAPGTPLFTTAGEVFAIAVGEGDPAAALVAPAVARLRERIASGQARRGALGLTFQALDDTLQKVFASQGVLIADVAAYGPADEAGVEPGDVLVAIGNTRVSTPDDARQTIAALGPQSAVSLTIVRDAKTLTVATMATSALALRVQQIARPRLANSVPVARMLFDARTREAAGLRPDSRILAINDTTVDSADAARAVLRRTRAPLMLYVEDARGRFFRVVESIP